MNLSEAKKKQSPGLRPSRPKAKGGQGPTEYLLMLAALLVILAVAVYYATSPSSEEYITIEGRIVEIKTEDRLVLILENDDGTFAISFDYTNEVLPIGQNIKLTYFQTHRGSRIIENVVVC